MSDVDAIRAEIIGLYETHEPSRVGDVDKLLSTWAGREDQLLVKVRETFKKTATGGDGAGKGSGAAAAAAAAEAPPPKQKSAAELDALRRRLRGFYEERAPQKLGDVETVVQKLGHLDDSEIFSRLEEKYPLPKANAAEGGGGTAGAAEPLAGSTKQQQQEQPAAAAPPAVVPGDVTTGAEADPSLTDATAFEARLRRIFETYDRPQLPKVGKIAAGFSTPVERQAVVNRLLAKYGGPEPTAATSASPPVTQGPQPAPAQAAGSPEAAPVAAAGSAATAAPPQGAAAEGTPRGGEPVPSQDRLRRKLAAFYQQHDPSKVSKVDAIIDAFGGDEAVIAREVAKKYPGTTLPATPPPEPATPAIAGGGSGGNDRLRARMQRFYAKRDPAKVDKVDAIIAGFGGDEKRIFEELAKKYPNQPPTPEPEAAAPTPTSDRDRLRARMQRFYAKRDPGKVDKIDAIIAGFGGDEKRIFEELAKKYPNQPPTPEPEQTTATSQPTAAAAGGAGGAQDASLSYRERVTALFEERSPEQLPNVDSLLNAFAGNEEELLQRLDTRYPAKGAAAAQGQGGSPAASHQGGSPAAASAPRRPEDLPPRERARRMLQRYNPTKLGNLDAIIQGYAGREHDLIPDLVNKYGPEPTLQDSPAAVAGGSSTQGSPRSIVGGQTPGTATAAASGGGGNRPRTRQDTVNRIKRFYETYCPENLGSIERVMTAFNEDEEAIMAALVQKYGPEPDRTLAGFMGSNDFSQAGGGDGRGGGMSSEDAERKLLLEPGKDGMVRRLTSFYRKYAPDKLSDIGRVMQVWGDREPELFAALYDKYDVPPSEQFRVAPPVGGAGRGGAVPVEDLGRAHVSDRSLRFGGAGAGPGLPPGSAMPATSDTARPTLKRAEEPCIDGRGKLVLHVKAAHNLMKTRRRRFNDGIVVVVMYPQKEVFRTAPSEDEVNPTWSERDGQAMIALQPDDRVITVRVADADQNFLGEAILHLDDMPFVGIHGFALQKRTVELDPLVSEASSLGHVSIKWGFVPDFALPAILKPNDSTGDASAESSSIDWRLLRLRAFFARYLPERLSEVPQISQQYSGREVDLLDCLTLRFGPEPDPYEFRARLERIFAHYDPSRVREAAAVVQQCNGREEFVLKSLAKKYGPEPGAGYTVPPPEATATNPPNCPHRTRLARWLMLVMPRRVAEVDYLLHRFAGREDVMFRLMAQTLGPEPNADAPRDNIRSRFATTPALKSYFARRKAPPFLDWLWTGPATVEDREASAYDPEYYRLYRRLERFYRHYNPVKVQEIEETLSRWRGREDLLFEALVHKYGAEPPEVADSRETPLGKSDRGDAAGGGQLPSDDTGPSRHSVVPRTPRAVLQSFYASHNPSKLRDVEDLLERFLGREEQLYHLLHVKYGIDPTALPSAMDTRDRERRGGLATHSGHSVASPLGSLSRLIKPPSVEAHSDAVADAAHVRGADGLDVEEAQKSMFGRGMLPRTAALNLKDDDAADVASDYSQV